MRLQRIRRSVLISTCVFLFLVIVAHLLLHKTRAAEQARIVAALKERGWLILYEPTAQQLRASFFRGRLSDYFGVDWVSEPAVASIATVNTPRNYEIRLLSQLRSIKAICICSWGKPPIDESALSALLALPNLDFLGTGKCVITDQFVGQLQRCGTLTTLSIDGRYLSPRAVEYLAACRGLRHLTIMNPSVCLGGAAELDERLPDCKVRFLWQDQEGRILRYPPLGQAV